MKLRSKYITKRVLKVISLFLLMFVFRLITAPTAQAVCPICTVAVAGGLGLSRYFGIDDSISGIWVGGLIVSLTIWTVDWLSKKNWDFLKNIRLRFIYVFTFLFYILITYPPLYWANIIGHPFNTILGIDKLVFGSVLGAVTFVVGVWANKKVRQIKGHQLFNYQKVVFPFTSLLIISLVLYFFGGYLYKL